MVPVYTGASNAFGGKSFHVFFGNADRHRNRRELNSGWSYSECTRLRNAGEEGYQYSVEKVYRNRMAVLTGGNAVGVTTDCFILVIEYSRYMVVKPMVLYKG
jgi:hypothetical protein